MESILYFERGIVARSTCILICWALSKESSGTIFKMSLLWSGQGFNLGPSAHGANAVPLTTAGVTKIWKKFLPRSHILSHFLKIQRNDLDKVNKFSNECVYSLKF